LFFLRNNYKKIILIFILLITLVYALNIAYIPNSLILFENEEINIKSIWGIELEETVEVGSNLTKSKDSNGIKYKSYNLSLLGFNFKKITANVIPNTKVVPIGSLVGLKLYTQGVLVVGMREIKGEDNKIYKPCEQAGIEQGDSIIEINDVEVNSTEELITCVSKGSGETIDITYVKEGKVLETQITPVKTSQNTYKLGLWVRDAEAGIGTVTFYEKASKTFAALGHAIQDIDTGELVEISSGEFVTADILNIQKGEKDNPGKIEGSIEDGIKIGEIYSNTEFGVYGITNKESEIDIPNIQEVEVASRNQIEIGKASIICSLEDGKREEYEVEIQKIYIIIMKIIKVWL